MKLYKKILFALGFFLISMMLTNVITPNNINIAHASTIEDKKPEARLNLKSTSIVKGKDFALKVYHVSDNARITFKSGNPDIASVNSDGLITGKKVGQTSITVAIRQGINSTTLACDVTVGPPAVSIKSNKSRVILGLNKNDLLKVILKPSNTAEEAKFSSYDSSIASISSGGRITGKELGFTYVFAEIGESKEGSRKFSKCSIIVVSPEDVEGFENLFNNTAELNNIPDSDFTQALEDFFKGKDTKNAESFDKFLRATFDFDKLKDSNTTTGHNVYEIENTRDSSK